MMKERMKYRIVGIRVFLNYILWVEFTGGITKLYDMKALANKVPVYKRLLDSPEEFGAVSVDVGGYRIVWNDNLDLSCYELWVNGVDV